MRRGQERDALAELALAARLDPATARAEALRVLEAMLKRHPHDREIRSALDAYRREAARSD